MRRVLITAGASGIGREMARAFAAEGALVFVVDLDAKGLSALAQEIPGVQTAICDMSRRADIERMVPAAVAALGGLDVLVNNAGIAGPTAPVEETDPDAWDQVLQVNLSGTFHVTRLAIPHLKKSPAGSIIVLSSVAGRFGYPNRCAYAATKWGLIGFTKTLARELGPFGIRANAIAPGAVEGPRIDRVFEGRAERSGRTPEEEKQAHLGLQSLPRLVDPRDIAALAVFLASDAGKSISGQVLPIDNDTQQAS
ncbi:MAG: SDR family oxidoreductase [Planctomycetaceae bacterium]|nr:SDR family oxidoreductase [Planctomycetaceae bacterium]